MKSGELKRVSVSLVGNAGQVALGGGGEPSGRSAGSGCDRWGRSAGLVSGG